MESTTEIWKDIKDYPGLYQVSNAGRVKSLSHVKRTWKGGEYLTEERILIPQEAREYLRVNLCNDGDCNLKLVHRLVGIVFVPNPENKPYINHINGNKKDNRACNLEWTTQSENQLHAINVLGAGSFGEKCHLSKLNARKIIEIKNARKEHGYTYNELSKRYNISISTVWQIVTGKTWKNIKQHGNEQSR